MENALLSFRMTGNRENGADSYFGRASASRGEDLGKRL